MNETESRWAFYDRKSDTVYINADAISPNTRGMTWKEHCKAYDEAFALSYPERIERYANPMQKEDILRFIANHKGCNLSEYSEV